MPPKSKAQQRAAGADLERIRQGKPPRTFKKASPETIREFATGAHKGLPRKRQKK